MTFAQGNFFSIMTELINIKSFSTNSHPFISPSPRLYFRLRVQDGRGQLSITSEALSVQVRFLLRLITIHINSQPQLKSLTLSIREHKKPSSAPLITSSCAPSNQVHFCL